MNEHHVKVDACLRHFTECTGAPPLVLNEEGVCAFTYKETLEIALELPEESTHLYFYAPVMLVPEEARLELYERLLMMNAYCAKTRGATLALDPNEPRVLLCYLYPVDLLDEVNFFNLLTNFVETLEMVRQQFIQNDQSSGPDETVEQDWRHFANRV